jgi:uncharacterized iron-regulated membrane protein
MNGRQIHFGVPGHPVAQFLAMIAVAVVFVGALIMGAFVLVALLGLAVIGYVVFAIRAWWRKRTAGRRGPSADGPQPGPAKGVRYIEGEYEVIEDATDAERHRSGKGS